MDRERGSKVIAIVALCVGVVGLSLGFAAFSSNLTIKSSATVTVADNFSVYFDKDSIESQVTGGAVAGTPNVTNTAKETGSEVYAASEISGLSAAFTAPGQSVTYTFDAKNNGQYVAYLTNVTFGAPVTPKCTAAEGTTQALVNEACKNISLSLSVDGETITPVTQTYTDDIAIGGTSEVVVTITYATSGLQNEPLADGDFTVEFGEIGLVYKSVR